MMRSMARSASAVSAPGMNAAGSTGARGPDQCATRADKVTNDDAGGLRNVTYEQVARNNPCAPTFLRKSLTDRTSDYAFQRFPQQVGPFSRLPNPGEMTQTGSPRAKALIASMSSGAAVSAAAKRFKVTLPRLLRRRNLRRKSGSRRPDLPDQSARVEIHRNSRVWRQSTTSWRLERAAVAPPPVHTSRRRQLSSQRRPS